jgi:hypothetical protein
MAMTNVIAHFDLDSSSTPDPARQAFRAFGSTLGGRARLDTQVSPACRGRPLGRQGPSLAGLGDDGGPRHGAVE